MPTHAPSVYDRLRPHLVAEDVLRRLGAPIVRQLGSEAYLRPLCHESTSGESLQVNLHTGRWNCKACQHSGVFGDLIQFVEYWQSGGRPPTHQKQQGGSETHRSSLRWLCEQYAVPYEEARGAHHDPALDWVHAFAMDAHEHLKQAPEVLEWIQQKWGFDRSTVEQYGIGFMPSPILPRIAAEANQPSSRDGFRSSGLGFYPPGGSFTTRFEGRVTFPYFDGAGRALYLIGRATPWTPRREDGGRVPKYHKLSVYGEQRPYVSKSIRNDHLYNEAVMETAQVIVVAEGVADAVALSVIGAPVVSPVTISFNAADLERFVEKCLQHQVKRVEILFDNELSGSGYYGALRVGRKLVERGICAMILTLPLGASQVAAREEVLREIGAESFQELERAEPRRRKEIIAERAQEEARRQWVASQVEASKIDAAEWCAQEGAGAIEKFNLIRASGEDVVLSALAELAGEVDQDAPPQDRLAALDDAVRLAACIDDRIVRGGYAAAIARAAGKGVTKVDAAQAIAAARRLVRMERKEAEEEAPDVGPPIDLVVLPPAAPTAAPLPPPTKDAPDDGRPKPPPPPGILTAQVPEHDRFASTRQNVSRAIEKKTAEEVIGRHVAETITVSMGFTVFRTPEDLVLVRGNERVDVGVSASRSSPTFTRLLYTASGLTHSKSSHRSYIAAAVYFLELSSTRVRDVSWSHYDQASKTIFFPTGDASGTIFRITSGAFYRTRMSEAKTPAVAGENFAPITYREECAGSIGRAQELLRWVSLSPGDRLILVYWVVCLPILRKIGEIPIVRIEGGSSSGKSRTVDAIAHLVNGRKTSTVPTAAAMTSMLSREMLTIDDNRESRDMTDSLRSTLLQATGQGARQKRRNNSDTETVTERVCGALLMNGIEPIHDGRSEIASRLLTLRSDSMWRAPDSPAQNESLYRDLLGLRDDFWSEAVHRCAQALDLDAAWGESIGAQIEMIFGSTRIGRLSAYMRLMYLTWVAGQPTGLQAGLMEQVHTDWNTAFGEVAGGSMRSLMHEELAVTSMRYAFAYGRTQAQLTADKENLFAWDGKYWQWSNGSAQLGPMSSSQLARIVREGGRTMNAPRAIAIDLSGGQLLARIQDGLGFLRDAGFEVEMHQSTRGAARLTIRRAGQPSDVGRELP